MNKKTTPNPVRRDAIAAGINSVVGNPDLGSVVNKNPTANAVASNANPIELCRWVGKSGTNGWAFFQISEIIVYSSMIDELVEQMSFVPPQLYTRESLSSKLSVGLAWVVSSTHL